MSLVVASAALTDQEFLAALDACTLPLSCFRHGDHLRFAWIQLHSKPFDDALSSVICAIRKYATHNGLPHIFHVTITTAWVKLLATHAEPDFNDFIQRNEHRLGRELLHRFWTPSSLNSEVARSSWLPPDRSPLPTIVRPFLPI